MTAEAVTGVRARSDGPAASGGQAKPRDAIGGYQPGLDGLRGVAMCIMLSYHAQLGWAKGAFLGLSQFFTLSGFLITAVLLRNHDRGGIRLTTFWTNRFRRLMPAALMGLVVVVVFGATVATKQQADALPGQVAAAAGYVANWFFIFTHQSYVNLFAAPSPVQHYWSLAVEEQFYVLMPVGLFLLLKRTRSWVVLSAVFGGGAVLSTVWMIHLYDNGSGLDRIYYGTDTRMAEILMGSLLAVVMARTGTNFSRRVRRVIAVVGVTAYLLSVLAALTVPLAAGPIWRGGMLGFSVLSCAVILAIVTGSGPVGPILSWAPFAVIGRLTYGVYLYHWPIFLWLTEARTGLSRWPLLGLRVGLTLLAASLSYNLVEMPMRRGAMLGIRGRTRLVAAPVAAIAIVVACFVTVDRSAPDPFATIRADDRSLVPPVQPTDGVLDLLVVTDAPGRVVIGDLRKNAASDPTVSVTVAPTFACPSLAGRAGQRTCSNWAASWPRLIHDIDPDVVLFYVNDWSTADLARLAGSPSADLTGLAAEVLGNGFDLLSAKGARIVFAQEGASFAVDLLRSTHPYAQAMARLEPVRSDLRHVLGGRLPDPDKTTRRQFLDRSAAALLADSSLYQRTAASSATRVLVVGDSQARSLGYGLERWGAQSHRALVWNLAAPGCGLIDTGMVLGAGGEEPMPTTCVDAVRALPKQVKAFRPDLVVVLTSAADLRARHLPGTTGRLGPGDAAFDRFILERYQTLARQFGATGASVIWMKAPCIGFQAAPGQADTPPDGMASEGLDHLNRVILPQLVQSVPVPVKLFDLDRVLCPGGQFRESIDGVDPIRVDGIHFSVDGSLWFAGKYGDMLLEMGAK